MTALDAMINHCQLFVKLEASLSILSRATFKRPDLEGELNADGEKLKHPQGPSIIYHPISGFGQRQR